MLSGAERLTLALDDTPTQRYGPHVQGAGIHHNPTPGPAGSPYVYGHVFVVLALSSPTRRGASIALPLLARLYVRKKDLPTIDPKHRPAFRTKLELAVELLRWAKLWLGLLGSRSGWWPTGPTPRRTSSSRRRHWDDGGQPAPQGRRPADTARAEPAGAARAGRGPTGGPDRPGQAGRPATGLVHRRVRSCTGSRCKRYKTFLATWRPAAGVIRVVLVDEPTGLAGVLLHRLVGGGRRHPGGGGGSVLAWRSRSASARRSSGPASSRCGSCGRTSGRSTSACGRSR